jgi:hypothetical protein
MAWPEGFKTGGSGFLVHLQLNVGVATGMFAETDPMPCPMGCCYSNMVCKIINVPPGLGSADDKSPQMDVIQVTC